MTTPVRISLLTLLCATPLLASAEPVAHVPAPAPAAAPSPASAPSEKKLSIEFRGNLRDALKTIAQQGGLNLVATGQLSQDAEVYLKDVTAEDALRTVAQAYNLKLQQAGSIWTLRPMTEAEIAAAGVAAPTPPTLPAPATAAAGAEARDEGQQDLPPLPPIPEIKPGMSEDAIEEAMRRAEEIAERATAEADKAMERAQSQADAIRQGESDQADPNRERADQLRERALELRERALEAREQAKEARERAKAAMRSMKKAMKERVGFTGPVVVKENEVVENAVAYGGPVEVQGHVKGDAVSLGGDVTLGPKAWVEGDVVSLGGSIHRADGAIVEGNVQAIGGAVLGKAVKDSLNQVRPASKVEREKDEQSFVAVSLAWFVVLFGVGFVANLAVPQRLRLVQEEIRRNPLKAGVTGLLASLALIPLTILLCVTIIGIPIALLVLWPVALLAYAVGLTVIASELGLRVPFFRGRKTQAMVLAMGLLFVVVAAQIPVLGPIAVAALGLTGFGAIVRTRFGGRGQLPGPLSDPNLPTAAPV